MGLDSRRTLLGLITSLLVHGAVFSMLHWAGTLPDVGIEISLPTEIELGVAEGSSAQPSGDLGLDGTATPPPSPPDQASAPAATAVEEVAPPKPRPKPKKRKPKPTDAGAEDTDAPADAAAPDASAGGTEGPSRPALAAYAPPGAQVALRLDMDRVRASPLAADATALLAAIPDVGFILDGSGVDPVNDLSRLFIASPNLQRASVVLAGRYMGDEDVPRRAVATLAEARGKTVKWSRRGGIPTAPWENADSTPRVLALLAPSLFAITRPDDLPRIVSVARALHARRAKEADAVSGESAADALLAMEPDEVVAFSVENARTFARGKAEQVPERLTVSIRVEPDGWIRIVSTGTYANADEAARALRFWQRTAQQLARHPLVALVGMSAPLRDTSLSVEAENLVAATRLTIEQAQRILAFARDMLARPRHRAAVPTGAPPPSPSHDAPQQ